ncbi:MAG TPA: F0F1 ATP synthase subunit B [Epsilonproteobacteria bacterium]|nr:F0F1 ATP synthase subunit B [Campylobacterota bacterium]
MKKSYMIIIAFCLPIVLLAAGGHDGGRYFEMTGRHTDFWARVFNFTIFASLLYYLTANIIRNFFKNRKEQIAKQLDEIEKRLQEATAVQKEAEKKLNESEKKAKEIIADAKKEAIILSDKVMQDNLQELAYLEKQFEEKSDLEARKSAKETINEVLGDNIGSDDILVDEKKVISILNKKVA